MRRYHHIKNILICLMNNNAPQRHHHSFGIPDEIGQFSANRLRKNKRLTLNFSKATFILVIYHSPSMQCLKNVHSHLHLGKCAYLKC
jgi:hypothetical protein